MIEQPHRFVWLNGLQLMPEYDHKFEGDRVRMIIPLLVGDKVSSTDGKRWYSITLSEVGGPELQLLDLYQPENYDLELEKRIRETAKNAVFKFPLPDLEIDV